VSFILVNEFDAGGGYVAKLLSPCAARLKESNTLTGPVLVGEFNARSFKSLSNCCFIGERNGDFPLNDLDPTDRRDTDFRSSGQVKRCPPQHCSSGAHLSARNFTCHDDINYIR
jgi:hypothetical protein